MTQSQAQDGERRPGESEEQYQERLLNETSQQGDQTEVGNSADSQDRQR